MQNGNNGISSFDTDKKGQKGIDNMLLDVVLDTDLKKKLENSYGRR